MRLVAMWWRRSERPSRPVQHQLQRLLAGFCNLQETARKHQIRGVSDCSGLLLLLPLLLQRSLRSLRPSLRHCHKTHRQLTSALPCGAFVWPACALASSPCRRVLLSLRLPVASLPPKPSQAKWCSGVPGGACLSHACSFASCPWSRGGLARGPARILAEGAIEPPRCSAG